MSRSAESLTRGGGDVYRNSACCQCSSWSWPEDVPSNQKLVFFTEFDPDEVFFKRGARVDSPQRQQQKQRPRRRTVLKRLTWASAGGCRCLHDAAGGLTPVSDGRLVWRCLGCPRGELAPRGQREPGGPRARPFRMRGRSSVAEAAGHEGNDQVGRGNVVTYDKPW